MNVSGFMQAFAIDSQISPSSKDNLEHFLVHLRADKPGREQNQPQEKWGTKATRGGLPVKWVTAGISVSSQGAGLSPSHLGKRDCSPGQAKRQECANATKSLQGEGWFQWGRWLLWKSAIPEEIPGALQTVPRTIHNKYPSLQRPVISTH